jgi:hypothetical protein
VWWLRFSLFWCGVKVVFRDPVVSTGNYPAAYQAEGGDPEGSPFWTRLFFLYLIS